MTCRQLAWRARCVPASLIEWFHSHPEQFDEMTPMKPLPYALLLLMLSTTPAVASASDWIVKTAGEDWSWGEDYVFAWAKYQIACEPGRRCQVGAGWKIAGKPRGEKKRFEGEDTITVIGAGALHFRADDGKGPAKYAFRIEDRGLVKTTIEW
jgi:hypothetical protein